MLERSSKYIGQHILLKFVTCAIITPFYSASLLETVQSEIASEKPEFLDVFKEGLRRLISFGVPRKGIHIFKLLMCIKIQCTVCLIFFRSNVTCLVSNCADSCLHNFKAFLCFIYENCDFKTSYFKSRF